jgi:hypothetical protein
MIRNFGMAIVVMILVATGLWKVVVAQDDQCPVQQQPDQQFDQCCPVQQQVAGSGPPFFLVTYDMEANLGDCVAQTYQNMANILNGYADVPADRTNYYSAVDNANDCEITGWQAIISNVQPNCNGYLVTLSIIPTLASNTFGQSAVIMDSDYSEQYQVNNDGSFTYEGFLDPNGLAGEMPSIATF